MAFAKTLRTDMHNLKDYATNMATWGTPTIPSGICVSLVKVYAEVRFGNRTYLFEDRC